MRPVAFTRALALIAPLALAAFPASAEDALKVAIGQINNWENQPPTLGAAIFKKHGLALETFGTQGAGETLQPVIAGSAELGVGIGVAGAMRAFAKGAPVRALLPGFTGTGDLYWYVKADSPIKSLKDATEKTTIAYSTSGSSSNNIVIAFVNELGAKAKPTATGALPGTLTAVMSGQVDIGWAAPPFGLKEVQDGQIRIIARGSDVPALRDMTSRLQVVNTAGLERRKDVLKRYMAAYRETLDWMYADPAAIDRYAEWSKLPKPIAARAPEYMTRKNMEPLRISGLPGIMDDAVKFKYIPALLSDAQLKEALPVDALK